MSKGKSKKVNPRRKPATWADLERAKSVVTNEAVGNAMAVFFTVLKDKADMDNETLLYLWMCVNKLSEEIVEGRVNISDLKTVLKEEYGVKIG